MAEQDTPSTGKAALFVLFMVTMIDMIGFGIIIPFLTYLVKDLAEAQGIVQIGLWMVADVIFGCHIRLFSLLGCTI